MIDFFNGGNYNAISCHVGTFTEESARIILNIHKLRDIKSRVKGEEQWIKTRITLPNPSCSYSVDDLAKYANLIFDNPDGSSVLSHNRYILGSDLATVARKGWISHAILSGLTDILQMNTKHTSVLMLNDVLMIGNDDLQKYLSGKLSRSTTRIVFVVNVGRTKSNEVYISSPDRPGCHWALLYIDLKSNKWYYCDTICWGSPSDLRGVVSPVVTAIHQVLLTVPKPFAGIVESYVETSGSTSSTAHTCSTTCLRNIPVQTCMSVCGVAVAILAAIAAKAPSLWKDVFLKRKGVLPDSLEWLMSPTGHSDFLRITLISWLITGSVDISVIGVPEDHIDHVQMATRGKDQGYVHVEGGKTVEMKDDEGSDVHVEERDAVEIVEIMESDDGSCENVSEGQVEDDGEDDEENSQMKGDGEGSDVHVEERDAVEMMESDDGSCENVNDGQVEGDREDHEENSQVKGDGEGSDVHVEERDAVDIMESDDGSCESVSDGQVEGNGEDHEENSQVKGDGEGSDVHVVERDAVDIMESDDGSFENVNDGQVEDDGEGDEKDGGVHDNGRETDEGNDISPGSGQIDDRYKGESLPEDGNEENNSSSGTDENEDQRLFFVGQTFSDLDQLEKRKTKYEEFNFCELWKRDVRTLEAAARRVPKRVAIAKSSLKYYSLKLVCKFGGEAIKRTQRIRNTKTFRQGCPFEVYLILSQDGQHLEVIRVNEAHTHVANKTIYEHLPRQRASRVKQSVDNIAEAIKLQANPKLLQQKVEEATGRKVTLKDISNIKQRSKQDINKNNLEDVIQHLKNQPGSTTEVIIDKDDNFKGIFYQDKYMHNLFEKFPEMILVDATYKLLDLRMPVYLLMCIDGDGLSEIVAMFTLAEETKDVIQATVEIFKKHNPSWSQTKVIMSDKDFTERDAFTSCFPGASLNICLYHTLRSLRREVTCEKLGISSAERLRALEILSSMAHSKTATEYHKALDELKSSNMKSVIEYVVQNWDPIKDQWVACFKDKAFNLGETTNNRLESTFSKIKSVCSRYASLMQFFF